MKAVPANLPRYWNMRLAVSSAVTPLVGYNSTQRENASIIINTYWLVPFFIDDQRSDVVQRYHFKRIVSRTCERVSAYS